MRLGERELTSSTGQESNVFRGFLGRRDNGRLRPRIISNSRHRRPGRVFGHSGDPNVTCGTRASRPTRESAIAAEMPSELRRAGHRLADQGHHRSANGLRK